MVLGPIRTSDPVNRSHPLNQGLASWWLALPHLSGGPTWYDIAGRSHGTMTSMGNASNGWRGTTRPGGLGHVQFDGASGYVDCGNPGPFTAGAQTYSCWVNPGRTTSVSIQFLMGPGSRCLGIDGTYNGSGKALFYNGSTVAYGPTPLVVGAWHFLAGVVTASSVTVYTNRTSVTTSQTAAATPGSGFFLGMRGDSQWPVLGAADNFRVWNRALSPGEIAAVYDQSRRGDPDTLNRHRVAALLPRAAPAGSFKPYYHLNTRRRRA